MIITACIGHIAMATAQIGKSMLDLKEIIPQAIYDLKYASTDNFTGAPVPGYESNQCLLLEEVALALKTVQHRLQQENLTLVIYDCYRPPVALNSFITWAQQPEDQPLQKQRFYPRYSRQQLFELGYLARNSSHTKGTTVDLAIAQAGTPGEVLDFGGHFDFFDPLSHTLSPDISNQALANRLYLRELMSDAGLTGISTEWWHFSYKK